MIKRILALENLVLDSAPSNFIPISSTSCVPFPLRQTSHHQKICRWNASSLSANPHHPTTKPHRTNKAKPNNLSSIRCYFHSKVRLLNQAEESLKLNKRTAFGNLSQQSTLQSPPAIRQRHKIPKNIQGIAFRSLLRNGRTIKILPSRW